MTKRRPKGSGTIQRTRDGRYRARFPFTPNDRGEVGTFPTIAEANAALDGILAQLRDAGATRGLTLRRLGEQVLDRRELEGYRSVTSERQRWKAYVEPWALVNVPVKTVTRSDVREWLAKLSSRKAKHGGHLAKQTLTNALNLLRTVFAAAVEGEHLEHNPCADVRAKGRAGTLETSTFLTLEEARALTWAAVSPLPQARQRSTPLDGHAAAAIALAWTTGLRQGELRSLLWEDVHADHIVVRFGAPRRPTKTGKIRRVPLLPLAKAALSRLPRRAAMVLPTPSGGYRPKGKIVDRESWKAWLARAGLTRRVRWQDLRHSCATLLLTGAIGGRPWSYEEVKEMLGHSTVKTTERYARATGTLAERAVRELDKATTRPQGLKDEVAQALEILGRRGWDSNPRMTVLQTDRMGRGSVDLDALVALYRSYVEAVARGDVHAHRHGLAAVTAAWSYVDELRGRRSAAG